MKIWPPQRRQSHRFHPIGPTSQRAGGAAQSQRSRGGREPNFAAMHCVMWFAGQRLQGAVTLLRNENMPLLRKSSLSPGR